MARAATIGSAIVRFLTTGVGKVRAELGLVQTATTTLATATERQTKKMERLAAAQQRALRQSVKDWDKLGKSIEKVGAYALGTLTGLVAAGTGFARVADPVGWDNLSIAIQKIGIQLGRIFVPALRAVTTWLDKAVIYLENLSDAARENILHWVKVTAATLASVAAFGIFGGMILRVINQLRLLGSGLAWIQAGLASIGVAPWIVALTAIGVAIGVLSGMFSGFGSHLQELGNAFSTLFQALGNALSPLVSIFGVVAQVVASVLTVVVDVLASVVNSVASVVNRLSNLITVVTNALAPFVAIFMTLASVVLDVLAVALTPLIAVLSFLMNIVASVIDSIGEFGVVFVAVFAGLLFIPTLIEGIMGAFTGLIGAVKGLIGVFPLVVQGIRAMGTAMVAFMSNPWVIGFTLIAAAIAAIAVAVSGVNDEMETTARRMSALHALHRRLTSGARVTREDLSTFLTDAEIERFFSLPEGERPAFVRGLRTASERELATSPSRDAASASEARWRAALLASPETEGVPAFLRSDVLFGPTGGAAREARRERLRLAGIPERLLDTAVSSLDSEAINRFLTAHGPASRRTGLETRIGGLRALELGHTEGIDRFKGEARVPKADYVGIVDLARRIQTASTERPEDVIARYMLEHTRAIAATSERTAIATETVATRRPIVPGG